MKKILMFLLVKLMFLSTAMAQVVASTPVSITGALLDGANGSIPNAQFAFSPGVNSNGIVAANFGDSTVNNTEIGGSILFDYQNNMVVNTFQNQFIIDINDTYYSLWTPETQTMVVCKITTNNCTTVWQDDPFSFGGPFFYSGLLSLVSTFDLVVNESGIAWGVASNGAYYLADVENNQNYALQTSSGFVYLPNDGDVKAYTTNSAGSLPATITQHELIGSDLQATATYDVSGAFLTDVATGSFIITDIQQGTLRFMASDNSISGYCELSDCANTVQWYPAGYIVQYNQETNLAFSSQDSAPLLGGFISEEAAIGTDDALVVGEGIVSGWGPISRNAAYGLMIGNSDGQLDLFISEINFDVNNFTVAIEVSPELDRYRFNQRIDVTALAEGGVGELEYRLIVKERVKGATNIEIFRSLWRFSNSFYFTPKQLHLERGKSYNVIVVARDENGDRARASEKITIR